MNKPQDVWLIRALSLEDAAELMGPKLGEGYRVHTYQVVVDSKVNPPLHFILMTRN